MPLVGRKEFMECGSYALMFSFRFIFGITFRTLWLGFHTRCACVSIYDSIAFPKKDKIYDKDNNEMIIHFNQNAPNLSWLCGGSIIKPNLRCYMGRKGSIIKSNLGGPSKILQKPNSRLAANVYTL